MDPYGCGSGRANKHPCSNNSWSQHFGWAGMLRCLLVHPPLKGVGVLVANLPCSSSDEAFRTLQPPSLPSLRPPGNSKQKKLKSGCEQKQGELGNPKATPQRTVLQTFYIQHSGHIYIVTLNNKTSIQILLARCLFDTRLFHKHRPCQRWCAQAPSSGPRWLLQQHRFNGANVSFLSIALPKTAPNSGHM